MQKQAFGNCIMIKLVMSDVDGTLLSGGESELSADTKRAIGALLSSGCAFAVASGRTYSSLSRLFREYSDMMYFICCDGALCVHSGRTLYHRPVSDEDIRKAFAISAEKRLSLLLSSATKDHIIDRGNGFTDELALSGTERFVTVRTLSEIKEPIYKLAFYGDTVGFNTVPNSLRLSYSANRWSEYVYRYADKGTALSDLKNRLYLTSYDTAAIGDGENDISMLKGAKYRFALMPQLAAATSAPMTNSAIEALKEIALMNSPSGR